jgi:hypothetical protein
MKKGKSTAEEEGTALVPVNDSELMMVEEDDADLMRPDSDGRQTGASDAGLGSEDIDAGSVILPRIGLLQSMSKAVTQAEEGGPLPGTWWLTPHNRPVTLSSKESMKIVVVKIYPTQRLWTPLDQGGGLVCEASQGDLTAREPMGLSGATLTVLDANGVAQEISWEGGNPTDNCRNCVYGLGAAAAATGRAGGKTANSWLPKFLVKGDTRIKVPDELRRPACQSGLDALVLVLLPAFNGQPPEIIPAFLTFGRSGLTAGRSLAGMIKMDRRSPAWGRIYAVGVKKTTNDRGTFFVPTVSVVGASKPQLMVKARELFDAATGESFRPDMSDADVIESSDSEGGSYESVVPSNDEPAPADQF